MVEGIRKKKKSYLFNVTLAFCRGRFKNNVFIMFVIMEKNGMSRGTAGKTSVVDTRTVRQLLTARIVYSTPFDEASINNG